jgi:hypothetical protein
MPYKMEPFKHEAQPKTWGEYIKAFTEFVADPEIDLIIVDSQAQIFDMLENEMSKNYTGFDIYKNVNKQIYGYLELLKNASKDCIIISHDELVKIDDGEKVRRMVAPGRKWEGSIEKAFTIVLYSATRIKDSKPSYYLKTFEEGASAKVPENMFLDEKGKELMEVPNSAEFIFNALKAYYSN